MFFVTPLRVLIFNVEVLVYLIRFLFFMCIKIFGIYLVLNFNRVFATVLWLYSTYYINIYLYYSGVVGGYGRF